MSTSFQEKRISNIWFVVILLSAFAILFAVEIMIQLNTQSEVFKHLRRVEGVITLQGFSSADPSLMPLLEQQGKEMEVLLNLSEQKARIAASMKKRLDSHAVRLSAMEHEMEKLLKEERVQRVQIPKAVNLDRDVKLPKLGPRK